MKNKLTDLNNYLFEQVERLMDDDICSNQETTKKEIARSDAVVRIAKSIIDNGRLQLAAVRTADELGLKGKALPDVLQLEQKL